MQNVKGTYDFIGPNQALRKKVQDVLAELFELYDFKGMETAVLNELDLLASKYAGGDEILKEMYRLSDQGGRSLGLRYDLTIPFAKTIALNPGLEMPYKRYEIGKVFRDGPVKRGRLREFLQCDVDMVGIAGPEAEAELMQLAVDAFGRLDMPVVLRWNNRRFLGEALAAMGVPEDELSSVMLTLDKLAKIGLAGMEQELAQKGICDGVKQAILAFASGEKLTLEAIASRYGISDSQGTKEAAALDGLIRELGLEQTCIYDPFLSRGLSFYTGTVYEIFDASGVFTASLGAGGRYDAIIGKLVGREDVSYPTVGLSFGMESILEMLRERPVVLPSAQAVVVPIGEEGKTGALKAAAELRRAGIRTALETANRRLKKSLAAASAKGIRYAVLLGGDEAAKGVVRLKDMRESREFLLSVQEAAATILAQSSG
ncbi:histidine--tRNA ligase [Paenibacillus sp. 1011MAR3C5]|uniref:histidine--tRNA ligase n=1 Tax=Paenibacillus sp. 1011MAR3C5 TaxID=1675787 RepID=UPI000E6B9A8B|nr:histidine--tRNA ligase [Paenibacillus sp. 1011MAR3C5]RJE87789.1 histidine--tRNA ligase [Paenibacillus sp. 1011MAR3C5]